MEDYHVEHKIGGGAFGEVYRAVHRPTGDLVALKRIIPRSMDRGGAGSSHDVRRELAVLSRVAHPNALHLRDAFRTRSGALVLVTDFVDGGDLASVIRAYDGPLPEAAAKGYFQQLLAGLAHLHECNILHRDIKPANLLLTRSGCLKIADFGLARSVDPSGEYTAQVATRWYRAPELLYGSRLYSAAVDIWAAGCVLVELLTGCPLFRGESDIDQLYRVLQVVGTPDRQRWPHLDSLLDYGKIEFQYMPPQEWEHVLPEVSPEARALVAQMLHPDPASRPSAMDLLHHPYLLHTPPAPSLPPSLPRIVDRQLWPLSHATARRAEAAAGSASPRGGGRSEMGGGLTVNDVSLGPFLRYSAVQDWLQQCATHRLAAPPGPLQGSALSAAELPSERSGTERHSRRTSRRSKRRGLSRGVDERRAQEEETRWLFFVSSLDHIPETQRAPRFHPPQLLNSAISPSPVPAGRSGAPPQQPTAAPSGPREVGRKEGGAEEARPSTIHGYRADFPRRVAPLDTSPSSWGIRELASVPALGAAAERHLVSFAALRPHDRSAARVNQRARARGRRGRGGGGEGRQEERRPPRWSDARGPPGLQRLPPGLEPPSEHPVPPVRSPPRRRRGGRRLRFAKRL